jgi:hypothetical protein
MTLKQRSKNEKNRGESNAGFMARLIEQLRFRYNYVQP